MVLKIGSILGVVTLFLSLLFQNLCFSGYFANSIICKCNHGSTAEKHEGSHSASIDKKDCHNSQSTPHRCVCKKSDIQKVAFAFYGVLQYVVSTNLMIAPLFNELNEFTVFISSHSPEYPSKIFRPPILIS
jgi:hypothetical protein